MPSPKILARLVAVAVGLLLVAALLIGSAWAAVVVALVAIGMAALSWRTWALLGTGQRVLRVGVLVLLLGWSAVTLYPG